MRLIHYTHPNRPLTKIEYREQDRVFTYKPTGFWVSDEDEYGWKQWCEDEGFRPEHLELAYEIILVQDHNVRILTTTEEIEELTRIYHTSDRYELDWMKMRERWDGLIITPYQWELRLDPEYTWYYAWDCASGCIWNPAAVEGFLCLNPV